VDGGKTMKYAVLFPGYGSQFVGMGKELYDESRVMQELFEEAYNCLNVNFVKLCFASSEQELAKMNNAYLSIFLVSSSFYALVKELGITPSVVAGYGTGHFSALFAADSISFPDGLYLLSKYASFFEPTLEESTNRLILVQGIPHEELEKLCIAIAKKKTPLFIAGNLSIMNHLVVGHKDAIALLEDSFTQYEQVKAQSLPLEFGLYSPFMQEVAEQLKLYLEKVDFKDAQLPLLNSVDGTLLGQADLIKQNLTEHLMQPINWQAVIEGLVDCDIIIEVGPGSTLTKLVQERYPNKTVLSLNTKADLEQLRQLSAPAPVALENAEETKEINAIPEQ